MLYLFRGSSPVFILSWCNYFELLWKPDCKWITEDRGHFSGVTRSVCTNSSTHHCLMMIQASYGIGRRWNCLLSGRPFLKFPLILSLNGSSIAPLSEQVCVTRFMQCPRQEPGDTPPAPLHWSVACGHGIFRWLVVLKLACPIQFLYLCRFWKSLSPSNQSNPDSHILLT